jgi:hypothetical protein
VRTEYLPYDDDFENSLAKYFDFIAGLEYHFDVMADQLEQDPLLAIDYLRRLYLCHGAVKTGHLWAAQKRPVVGS